MNKDFCFNCMKELDKAGVCPYCGFDFEKHECAIHHLEPGTILNGKYLVGRVLGEGGFGITYVGWDLNLHMKVAIKEYYPTGYVTRSELSTGQITVLTGEKSDYFYKGQEHFVEEARRLAKFWGLPGIVAVKDYFQENGTAYIVMEFVEGKTLKAILAEKEGQMEAAELLELLRPVMKSLQKIHEGGLIHRDISPDNLMIDTDGNVKLLDFGAARSFLAESEKSLSVILKPGYAPEEQYRSRGNQGPWTDVYALCATLYRALTGTVPVESLDRLVGEELTLPSSMGIALSGQQEQALMKGLAVLAKDRFQSVKELEEALYDGASVGDTAILQNANTVKETENRQKEISIHNSVPQSTVPKKKKKPVLLGLSGAAVAAAAAAVFLYFNAEYQVTVIGGEGTAEYKKGAEVLITAEDREEQGYRFASWKLTGEGTELKDLFAEDTSFVMPGNDVTVEALYEDIEYQVTVENGTGSGRYIQGTEIMLEAADRTEEGYQFVGWEAENAELADAFAEQTSFVMPVGDVTVAATYQVQEYKLTVQGAEGSGSYAVGSTVTLKAEDQPEQGYFFTGWKGLDGIVGAEVLSEKEISFAMPTEELTVEACFEQKVVWADPYFRDAVQMALGYSSADEITPEKLAEIMDLSLFSNEIWITAVNDREYKYEYDEYDALQRIGSLEDLKYFTGLENLSVRGISLVDLEPIAQLENLWNLSLGDCDLSDDMLAPLARMTKLEWLDLHLNEISNVDALSSLTNLSNLTLLGNNISNIDALESLVNMESLSLSYNENLRDISAVSSMKKLESLYLGKTSVRDISALSDLNELLSLDLEDTYVEDLSPVSHIPDLKIEHSVKETEAEQTEAKQTGGNIQDLLARIRQNSGN